MAISGTVVQSKSATVAASTDQTVTLDSAATAGNVLVAVGSFVGSGGTTSFDIPSGFTLLESTTAAGQRGFVAIKKAAGGETSFTAGQNGSTVTTNWNFTVAEFSGTDLNLDGTILSEIDITAISGSASQSFPSGSVTATESAGLAIAVIGHSRYSYGDGSPSWSNSFVGQVAQNASTTARSAVFMGTKVLSASGSVSTTYSVTDTNADGFGVIIVIPGEAAEPAPDPENPPTGKTVVEITSIPATDAESFVNYADPDLVSGDFIVADAVTTPGGYTFVVNNDGTFSYDAGGDESRQSVVVNAYDTSAEAYIGETTFWVNNTAPQFGDGSGDPIVLGYANSEAITTIDLYTYFDDFEDDTLTFEVTGTSTNTLAEVGLALSGSEITGTTTTTDDVYKVTIRATDIVGDSTDGEIWFAVDSYPYAKPQEITLDALEYSTATLITGTIDPTYETPNAVSFGGVAGTLEAGADETGFTVTTPAISDFLAGGDFNAVPWHQTIDLTLGFPTSADVTAPVIITGPADANESGDTYWHGVTGSSAGGVFTGYDSSPYFIQVTQGGISSVDADAGTITPIGYVEAEVWVYTAGAWTLTQTYRNENDYRANFRRRALPSALSSYIATPTFDGTNGLVLTSSESSDPIPLNDIGLLEKVNGYSLHVAWTVPAGSADAYVTIASIGGDGNDRLDLLVNLSTKVVRLERWDNGVSTVAIATSALSWSEGQVINIRASWGDGTNAMILYADAETASSNAAEAQADAPEVMTMFVLNGTAKSVPDDFAGGTYRGFKVWDYALSDAELAALSADDFLAGQGHTPGQWVQSVTDVTSVNDAWMEFLAGEGYTTGSLNDRMMAWLGDEGYTGALSDRLAAWSYQNLMQYLSE